MKITDPWQNIATHSKSRYSEFGIQRPQKFERR